MQPKYMEATLLLSHEARYELEKKYKLPRLGSLYSRLSGIDQAQVVLTLIRAELWHDVILMVGHIVPNICPPCLSKLHIPDRVERTPDEEMIVVWKTADNPRIVSDMMRRFAMVKVGMSVSQLLLRGVTRRDLRDWKHEGSIKLERRSEAKRA